ncbi:tax1-binding protein 1 homolog [Argiope bruennichi]|nr:tax1-binding protein 1 homolog [Argiope bruennichi]
MTEGVNKLSEEELFECLKSLNVPTRLSDIKTPTKEFLIRVFECFLKDLQIDIMHQNLRTFLSIKHIEYPEIIEEGQCIILLVMFINFITSADGLDIYARDIIFPKPKRTKKILNYLIVFWKYFLLKFANFQAIAEKFQEEKREADELAEENDQLGVKYNECLLILKNDLPSKEELISCNESKVEKCKEMEKQREALTEENSATKKKENDLQTLITKADVNIVSTKEQIKELEELILTSPEKISTEIKKLKDSIREEEMKIREKEAELKDKKKSLDNLKQILENDAKDLEELKNINKALQTFGDVVKSFILDFQKCLEEKENLRKLESELLLKEEMQSISEHKFAKIHLHYKKQKESYNETFQMLQRNLSEEQKDLTSLKAANLELDQKMDKEIDTILDIVEKLKEAEKTTEKLQMDYKSQMESIRNTFVSECGDIKSYIVKKYAP